MTGRFGIVIAEFGSLTDRFGEVTDCVLKATRRRLPFTQAWLPDLRLRWTNAGPTPYRAVSDAARLVTAQGLAVPGWVQALYRTNSHQITVII